MSASSPRPCWYVYLIECRDGSLYTGIAVDVALRYAKHVAGTGARYTRSHPPLRLIGQQACVDRAEASRLEYRIKQLSPSRKRELGAAWNMAGANASEEAQNSGHSTCSSPQIETAQTPVRR
ncbi:MAG: GIY-YIG nuclease family protein [Lysobacteraceae bacterium]|nr:MAG: GIY-YIG nuclease family protein [Xanthomonadaceae bacterium]